MATMEYREMEPHVEWIDSETVHVLVSGYQRDALRVQVTSSGKLKISGERLVDGGKVSRFEKELRIPDDCDVNGITARYDSEILTIRMPKSKAGPKHSHEPQLPDKRAHETLPQFTYDKNSPEPQSQPQLPDKRAHETMPQLPYDKNSHELESYQLRLPQLRLPQLPDKRAPETLPQLPHDKNSHEPQSQPQLPDKRAHETLPQLPYDKNSNEPQSQPQLPDKRAHEARPQLPEDKHSHEQHILKPRPQPPDKHHQDETAAPVAAKHDVAQRVREAEVTVSERNRHDRKFGGVGAGRLGRELENRKSKVTVVLVVVGALVVGYLSGRLDQAVRDGWTIVQRRL